ncbi:hypothetical protein M885DRAFT_111343 [Pelagophyceae sp. CCMP2097]|nr:hypothetical protein M885DRAFT_111343 [Pelagophyceae sp. CCMP2097]
MAEPASGGMPQEDPAVAEARATTFRKSIAKKVISLAAKKAVRKDEEKRARQFVAKAVQVVKWMDNEDWKTWNAHPMIKKYYAHRGFEGEDAADHYNVYQKVIRAAFVNERSNRTSKIKLAAKRLCGATREAAGDKELTGDDPAILGDLLPNMNRQEANVPAWDFLGKCAAASLPKRARADAIDTLTISDVAWIKTVLSDMGDDFFNVD